jgi:hypothetical protein
LAHPKFIARDGTFVHQLGFEIALQSERTGLGLTARRVSDKSHSMPVCKACGEEVDELQTVKVGTKSKKLCESCADEARESDAIAQESESVVQNMMGFKGRR